MRPLIMTLMLLSATVVTVAGTPPLTLARNGKPTATIVLGADPTLSAQFGALEFQWHVQRITGAVLPIVTDEQPVRGTRVLVGESAPTRKLKLPMTPLADEKYLIGFRPDALVRMGFHPSAVPIARPAMRLGGRP